MIYNEGDACVRVAELSNTIQLAYKEIRALADYHDIGVELRVPIEDGFYPNVIDMDYNNSDWQSSDC
jgi:hypothetical protein